MVKLLFYSISTSIRSKCYLCKIFNFLMIKKELREHKNAVSFVDKTKTDNIYTLYLYYTVKIYTIVVIRRHQCTQNTFIHTYYALFQLPIRLLICHHIVYMRAFSVQLILDKDNRVRIIGEVSVHRKEF